MWLIYWAGVLLNYQHWGRHRIVRNCSDGRSHAASSQAKLPSQSSQPSSAKPASQLASPVSKPANQQSCIWLMLLYPSLCSSFECYKIENTRNTHSVLSHVHCINTCRKTDSCLLRDAVTQLDVLSVLAICAFLCCYRLFFVYIAHAKLQSTSGAPNWTLFAELEIAQKLMLRWHRNKPNGFTFCFAYHIDVKLVVISET